MDAYLCAGIVVSVSILSLIQSAFFLNRIDIHRESVDCANHDLRCETSRRSIAEDEVKYWKSKFEQLQESINELSETQD